MIDINGGRLYPDQQIAVFDEDEDCFGNILSLAQEFGWADTYGNADTYWNPEEADACEDDALFYLHSKGVWVFVKNADGDLFARNC